MKIKLNLKEMIALSKIIEIQEVIGYKAALTKLFHEMLSVEEFAEVTDISEKIDINANEINKGKESERNEIIKKLQPFRNNPNDIPSEIQEELNQFNTVLFDEINKKNKENKDQIDLIIENSTENTEFEFNRLTISAIKNIVESEKKISDLGLNTLVIKTLIDIYIKIDSESKD